MKTYSFKETSSAYRRWQNGQKLLDIADSLEEDVGWIVDMVALRLYYEDLKKGRCECQLNNDKLMVDEPMTPEPAMEPSEEATEEASE